MSTTRHVDPGIMCDEAAPDGTLTCYDTVYASQVDRRTMAGLVTVLRRKGWSVSVRRGDQARDYCPAHAEEHR